MKNILTLVCCALALNSFGQTVPFNINYQGLARDADGVPISNAEIEATINILQGDSSGPVVFHEQHVTSTNFFGIYIILIGEGAGSDDLQNIDWSETDYFIETIISIDGESDLTNVSKLNSVPYAFLSYKSVIDEIEDADSDITNELQQLSLNGTELSLTDGNVVNLGSLIDESLTETTTSIRLNHNNNSIDYKDEEGVTTNLHLCNVVDNCESVTSMTFNSITNSLEYIDEDGVINSIEIPSGNGSLTETTTTIGLNHNNSSIDYKDEDGVTTNLNLCNVVNNCESVTSISLNKVSNSLEFIDEDGNTNVVNLDDVVALGDFTETITDLTFDHTSNQLVYKDEAGVTNIIDISGGNQSLTTLTYNSIDNHLSYVDENGNTNIISLGDLNPTGGFTESLTELTYNSTTNQLIYVDEGGVINAIEIPGGNGSVAETTTSIRLNHDNRSIDYKDEDGLTTNLNLCNVIDNCETVTSLTYNTVTNSLLYIDEDGLTHSISLDGLASNMSDLNEGNVIASYVSSDGKITDIEETVTTFLDNGDGSYSFTSEDGTLTTFYSDPANSAMSDLVDGHTIAQHTSEDGTVTSVEETVTSLIETSNGKLTYTDENGESNILDVGIFQEEDPEDVTKMIAYASLSGPEKAIFERGTAQLINGEIYIGFSAHFKKLLASNTLTVSLTPHSANTFGLAVIEKNIDGIRVKELMNGVSNFNFDWEVKATRKSELSYQVIRNK